MLFRSASDYPHGGSTWPNSKDVIKKQLSGFSDDVVQKLVWGNAAKLYDLR